MPRLCLLALLGAMFVLSGGLVGQEKKDDPKKKNDPPAKAKGMLPSNWTKLGLSDDQKQQVYKVQAKYAADIKKLKDQIEELESAKLKDMRAVLTADQKKKLEEIVLGKDK